MKYTKHILSTALAVLLLASCAKEETTKPMTTTTHDPNAPAATAESLPEGVAEQYALAELFAQPINRIVLTSGISGAQYTALDTDIDRIAEFCAPITGDQPGSDRGFYGSYFSIALYNGPIKVGYFYFSPGSFSTGHYETVKGHDYRIRYRMNGRTIDEIWEFFARYFPADFTTTAVPSPDTSIAAQTTANHVWGTAQNWSEISPATDGFDYSSLALPDYRTINPVRYLGVDSHGMQTNGWQDFGLSGELRTTPQPKGSTYLYQTYSYFIRNDLRHLYPNDTIPATPEALAEWLTEIGEHGRRALWFSMNSLPQTVELTDFDQLVTENGAVLGKATYRLDGEVWVVYLLCEENTASALAIRPNDEGDYVIAFTDGIAKSHRRKTAD